MAAFSDYLEDHIIDFFLRNNAATFTPPATVYVALFTADPGEGNTFTNEVPNTPNTYARQSVTFNAPSGGATANAGDVVFADMPAVTVTHVALVDTVTHATGNILYKGALTASKVVNAGDTFKIVAGDLAVSND